MSKKTITTDRGRPNEWTDDELKQLALDVKYKYHGKKLTPSMLEKETSVGRNTWSRRMKEFIKELNEPVLPTAKDFGNPNEATLPSVDLAFKKYGNDKRALKNELLNLEVLFYDLYSELKQYKSKDEQYRKGFNEINSLKEELIKQKKRAHHYEQLYNNIVISSTYPHLQDADGSQIHELGIKNNLIEMEKHKRKNVDLENLSSYFPDVSEETTKWNDEEDQNKKREINMKQLLNKFDI